MIDNKKKIPYEDRVLKSAMAYFGEELLPLLGIKEKVTGILPTEEITLIVKQSLMDYNFLTESRKIFHFEFQSTEEGEDGLRRFRRYEVNLSYHYGMEVITFVIFTGNIRNPKTILKEGINTYEVIPIVMQELNADEVFKCLHEKLMNERALLRNDLVSLLLTPLMSGKMRIVDRIKEAINFLRKAKNIGVKAEEGQAIEGILYVFASKFLEPKELEQVREVVKMTPLGQMLYEDGRAEGKAEGKGEGKLEGRLEIIFSLLSDLGTIPTHLTEHLKQEEDLEQIKEWLRFALQSDSIAEFELQMKKA